jgi:hypothetical protein
MSNSLHEFYAWRVWNWRLEVVSDSPSRYVLTSVVMQQQEWRGPRLKAEHLDCGLTSPNHPPEVAPAPDCVCGIWGVFSRPTVECDGRIWRMRDLDGLFITGIIKLCPPIVLGSHGVRCRAAEIRHLFVPAGGFGEWNLRLLVHSLESRYDCPVTVVKSDDELEEASREWNEKVWRSAGILRSIAGKDDDYIQNSGW